MLAPEVFSSTSIVDRDLLLFLRDALGDGPLFHGRWWRHRCRMRGNVGGGAMLARLGLAVRNSILWDRRLLLRGVLAGGSLHRRL